MIANNPLFPQYVVAESKGRNARCNCLAALVAIAVSFLCANVKAQTAYWIKQQGTGGITNGVSSDAVQNSYATGMVSNPALFDGLTIPCNAPDIFVVKYGPTAGLIWAKIAGGPLLDHGYNIATDTGGNSYVVGAIQTNGIYPTVSFDTITLTGHGDMTGSSPSTTPMVPLCGRRTPAEPAVTWLMASHWTILEVFM